MNEIKDILDGDHEDSISLCATNIASSVIRVARQGEEYSSLLGITGG